jgi:hypothetical protein
MDLPVFRRGLELVSSQLNKLSNSIRASTITSVIGGSLTCTPGGTTLIIDQQPSSPGTGIAAACPFKVTDISEPNGEELILKLNVLCEKIDAYNIWPADTSETVPNFVFASIPNAVAWYAVYLVIRLDQTGELIESSSVPVPPTVELWDQYVDSNSTDTYVYLAGVNVADDGAGGFYISSIENACPIIARPTLPSCPFLVEQSLPLGTALTVQIRSGKIAGAYPTGMDSINTYRLLVDLDQSLYWYVYCNLVVTNGVIQTGTNDITFSLETALKTSTSTLAHFLISEFQAGYDAQSNAVVQYIYNYCTVPFVSNSPASCPFGLIDASEGSALKVQVINGTVSTSTGARWPSGMSLGGPAFVLELSQSSYIYVKIHFKTNDVVVDPGTEAITVFQTSTVQTNTADYQYVLIGYVVASGSPLQITQLSFSCAAVVADPCALTWSNT